MGIPSFCFPFHASRPIRFENKALRCDNMENLKDITIDFPIWKK